MVKKLLFPLALLFCSLLKIQAQKITEKGSGLVHLERHQVKFGSGFGYELGLFKNASVSTSFGPGLVSYQEGYTFGLAWHTRFRYYTNFKRRTQLNKNVSGNSGDYISAARSVYWAPLQLSNNFEGPDDFAIAFYGLVYGVQRTYEKGFSFNVELGAGYIRGDGLPNGYGPMLNFSFGWLATKRKTKKPVIDWGD